MQELTIHLRVPASSWSTVQQPAACRAAQRSAAQRSAALRSAAVRLCVEYGAIDRVYSAPEGGEF